MARKKKKKNSFECFEEYAKLTLEQLDTLQKMLNKVSFQLMIATDDEVSEELEKERDEIQDKINTVMEEYNEVSEDYQNYFNNLKIANDEWFEKQQQDFNDFMNQFL